MKLSSRLLFENGRRFLRVWKNSGATPQSASFERNFASWYERKNSISILLFIHHFIQWEYVLRKQYILNNFLTWKDRNHKLRLHIGLYVYRFYHRIMHELKDASTRCDFLAKNGMLHNFDIFQSWAWATFEPHLTGKLYNFHVFIKK